MIVLAINTQNFLQEKLPRYQELPKKLARNAFIGFVSSAISDTVSNSIRVIKTYRQAHEAKISYGTAVKEVVAKDGWLGLFGRGLSTRIIANGMQGLLFSVLWKYFEGGLNRRRHHRFERYEISRYYLGFPLQSKSTRGTKCRIGKESRIGFAILKCSREVRFDGGYPYAKATKKNGLVLFEK